MSEGVFAFAEQALTNFDWLWEQAALEGFQGLAGATTGRWCAVVDANGHSSGTAAPVRDYTQGRAGT